MRMKKTIDAHVLNETLVINKDKLNELVKGFKDGAVKIIIEQTKEKRTANQNAYYWGVVIPAIQQGMRSIGERMTLNETENWIQEMLQNMDQDFTHKFLKDKFIDKIKVDPETNEVTTTNVSTRKLSTIEFKDYLDRIIQFANQILDIQIPEAE